MDISVPLGDAVKLHVRHREGTGGPPFLLLHGLDSNARMWDLVADRLAAEGHPVYAVDQRGHGDSDPADDDYGNETAAADIAAVADALGVTRAVVAGHSWGALVSLRLAARRPGLVAGLALIEGGWAHASVVCDSWEQFAGLLTMSEVDLNGATLDAMRDYQRAVYPDWSAEAVEASLHSLRVHEDGALTPRLSPTQRNAILRSIWDDPPAQWYPAITVPTLLMPAVPKPNRRWEPLFERVRSYVEPAVAALPDATVREYVGGDHDLHAQHPDEVAEDLLRLARNVQRRAALGDRTAN
ncbi:MULTISPECIES: alpha/beta fold hydrolase [Actinomadura]|uniref:Alpha/beta fold hydrolase n=1 Tax=Actinomadura yumaensis TaxID=111807 RepID=A0ABW2CKJ6_9ACTN|nr:alpha/beta hydrolase [Actinomadura sp. J1-007]MWK40683.1 alpha/beta fold hydrolase [Actinomadura sp. J1-007]QFU19837.1 polyketide thioesterase [Actinomadura sp.]